MSATIKNQTLLAETRYNKEDCTVGIVHVGIGAFHRAHQAAYINELLNDKDQQHWGIAGVNLRAQESSLVEQLQKQNHRYILKTLSPDNDIQYQEINAILATYDWANNPAAAANIVANESVHLVTMTVTESGYYLLDNGQLDLSESSIQEGLLGKGSCIYTYLRAALNARRENNGKAITLLCCDNLRHNGQYLKSGFEQFLKACDDHVLLSWIGDNVSFPSCMVDRITPRIAKVHADDVFEKFAIDDRLTVASESFSQWVIEDNFAGPFPPLERVGVSIVDDVEAYEDAKIRILNAGHTIVAYLAALRGYNTYDEAIVDAELDELFSGFQSAEVIPAIPNSPIDLNAYSQTVKLRFSNKNISDSIARICADGVSKFSLFILVTLQGSYQRGVVPHHALKGIAAWYVFMCHVVKGSIAFDYIEPKWDDVQQYLSPKGEQSFVQSEMIWGSLPKTHPEFSQQLLDAIASTKARFPY